MGKGVAVGVGVGPLGVLPADGVRVGGNLIPTAGIIRTWGSDDAFWAGTSVGGAVGVAVGTRTTATFVGSGASRITVSGWAAAAASVWVSGSVFVTDGTAAGDGSAVAVALTTTLCARLGRLRAATAAADSEAGPTDAGRTSVSPAAVRQLSPLRGHIHHTAKNIIPNNPTRTTIGWSHLAKTGSCDGTLSCGTIADEVGMTGLSSPAT